MSVLNARQRLDLERCRLPVPAGQRSTIEQEILHEVLSSIDYSKAKPASSGSIPADQTAGKE